MSLNNLYAKTRRRKVLIISVSLRLSVLKRKELNDEEAYHRDCGEGDSSRSHGLPDGHHNDLMYGARPDYILTKPNG